MEKLKVIAYYLPQFHIIPENDEWWGKGFTEWVNVKNAKPLFKGHKQPNVPAPELGYYNLLDDEARRKQTELAKEAGIDGFCYWHYWFGNGKQLLEKPFQMMLADKSNDHGFCLGWANETWKRKQWKRDGLGDVNLVEQIYPGKEDDEAHFYAYLDAFQDRRYLTYQGRPIFLIYRPLDHPYVKDFIERWNSLAKENGFENGFCFIAELNYRYDKVDYLKSLGFDFITSNKCNITILPLYKRVFAVIKNLILGRPIRVVDYSWVLPYQYTDKDKELNILPGILPNWDHSPRSGNKCHIIHNSTPSLFYKLVKRTLGKRDEAFPYPMIFIKSWNEWGEGNYMEPDMVWGKGYIQALHRALEEYCAE